MSDYHEETDETTNFLESMDIASLTGIESIIETLQEPFEDMERRILISSMVQDAVCRGFLKAMEEDFSAQLSEKDEVIKLLEGRIEAKDKEISNLTKGLKATGNRAEGNDNLSSFGQSNSVSVESLELKLREREEEISKKNMELECLASRITQTSSVLNCECERALLLENQLNSLKEHMRKKSQKVISLLHCESRNDALLEMQSTMQEMEQEVRTTCLKQHIELENIVVDETIATHLKELGWKADVESFVVGVLLEGWYRQVTELLQTLQVGLTQKDQRILFCEKMLVTLKQTIELLQNDTIDRAGGSWMDYSSRLISREVNEYSRLSGMKKEEENPELELKEVMNDELQYAPEFDTLLEALIRSINNIQDTQKLEIEQQFAREKLQHELELDIISVVFAQEFHDALHIVDTTKNLYSNDDRGEKTISNNFEDLEAQLESFLELEASKLEMIKSGCSTSIARCEFKLETLMENLAHQVNEMRTKISFVQEAVKQQEWKHMVEQDILITIIGDTVSEMNRKLYIKDTFISTELAEEDIFGKNLDSPLLIRNKDKVICLLKDNIDELRKEKAIIEQKLDGRTEELYSLKRQFWKEREFWVSRLSPPLIKEFEAQVEDLPKHSSGLLDLEEEYMNLERIRYDSLVAELRKEWLAEKEGLLQAMVEKEAEIGRIKTQLIENDTNSATVAAANLFARIADLSVQVDTLSNEKMKKDFDFTKREKEWHDEKRSIQGEVDQLLKNEQSYAAREHILLDKIAELENEVKSLQSTMLDQQSLLKFKEEWETEREYLLRKVLEGEDMMSRLALLSKREEASVKQINQLVSERDHLRAEQKQMEIILASFTEEREVANAQVIKERTEEEQKRKLLELELTEVKLELQNLQGLNAESTDHRSHFNSEIISEEQIDVKSLQALHEFRQKVIHTIEAKSDRYRKSNMPPTITNKTFTCISLSGFSVACF